MSKNGEMMVELARWREVGNKRNVADVLSHMAAASWSSGKLCASLECLLEEVAIRAELGENESHANTLYNLGRVYFDQGNVSRSIECYREAIARLQDSRNAHLRCIILRNLGTSLTSLRKDEEALQVYDCALRSCESERGPTDEQVEIENAVGLIHLRSYRPTVAEDHLRHSLELHRRIHDGEGNVAILAQLGRCCYDLNRPEEAVLCWEEAVEICQKHGDKRLEASLRKSIDSVKQRLD